MEFVDKCGLSPFTKFAYVIEPSKIDHQLFGETVARSRGLNVKVCGNTHDALGWLKIVTPIPHPRY